MAKSDDSIWLYNANFPLAIASAVLYAIPMCIQFYQTIIQYKAYYFVVVLIGACLEVGGYIARAVSIKQSSEIVCTPPIADLLWPTDLGISSRLMPSPPHS